jgi:dTDP-glucose 4,6-dehydratase
LASVEGHPRFAFMQGDIADLDAVRSALERADAVVNFAAETHVDRSILDAGDFVRTDVYGTWVLLETARLLGLKRFVHISTDEVYGSVEQGASREGDKLDPTSPYSASKAGGELQVNAYHKTYGLPTLIVRGANAYGPHQYPEKLIPLHITNALDDQPLPVYGDGQQRRQWTHVDDFCSGIALVLHQGQIGETYNVGSPEPDEALPVNLEVTRRILRGLGKPASLVEHVVDRPAHDRRYRVDPTKLLALGWQPHWTFWDGLEDTVRWYAANEAWWRPIKSGEHHRAYLAQNYADRQNLLTAPRS